MRAAIYIRVGNPGQLATRHQAEVLTRQIRSMWGDRAEIDIYDDNGFSGLQPTRPGLQELLRKAGTYDGVFVSDLDRLSRSVPDAVRLARQLKDSGTELYTSDGSMVEIMEEIMAATWGLST